MSSLTNVERFVAEGPTLLVVSTPQVGAVEQARFVAQAMAKGEDYLVWNRAKSNPDTALDHVVVKSVNVIGNDKVQIIERTWPNRVFTFRRPENADEREFAEVYGDLYEEFEDDLRAEIVNYIAMLPPVDASPALSPFKWARWSEFVDNELQPAGVVFYNPDERRFVFHPFDQATELASLMERRFRGWEGSADDAWTEMRAGLTRNTMVSELESIMAPSFNEAVTRALYRFAEDHYRETGKVLV